MVRPRNTPRQEIWLGFIGSGEVTEENAVGLLDNWLPEGQDKSFIVLLPDAIKRTQKGLKAVEAGLSELALDITNRGTPEDIVTDLINERTDNDNPLVYLIALWDEKEETETLIRKALDQGVRVQDLCAAMDDILLGEPEPEPEPEEEQQPRRRGRPRTTEPEAVEAKVEGPATVAPNGLPTGISHAQLLENSIRMLIREEIDQMGLNIGHNTRQTDIDPQDEKVRAFVDADGDYELAPKAAKKAPRGKRSVELTREEAKEVGLDV